MTDIDFDRLQPLRLAAGNHKKGSGYGCAMNVISYITGEAEISDYPACADGRLSMMVQKVNDIAAHRRGTPQLERNSDPTSVFDLSAWIPKRHLLAPADAVRAVNLGMMTIGTAGMVDIEDIFTATKLAASKRDILHIGMTPAETIHFAGWVLSVDAIFDFAEDILRRVREFAGLDAAPFAEIPAEVLL